MDPWSVSGFHVKTAVAQKKQALIEKLSFLHIFGGICEVIWLVTRLSVTIMSLPYLC